jgi:hypothetical protein
LPVPVSVELEAPAPPKRPTLTSVQLLATQQGAPPANPSALPFAGSQATRPVGFPAWLPPADVATGPAGFGYAPPAPRGVPRDEPTTQIQPGSYPPPPPPTDAMPRRERSITAEILVDGEATALPFDAPTRGPWDQPSTSDLDPQTPPMQRDTAPPPPPEVAAHMPFSVSPGAPAPASSPPAMATRPVAIAPPGGPVLVPNGEPGPIPDIGETLQPVLPPEPDPEPLAEPTVIEPTPQPAVLRIPIGPAHDLEATVDPSDASAMLDAATPAAEPTIVSDETAHEPTPAAPRPAVRDALTLEEAAHLRAQLTQKDADKAAVLASWGLAEEVWTRLEKEQLRSIDEGVQSGSTALLDRYDDAYLAAVGEIRGPLDDKAYARLSVARETGQLAQVLDELGLSRPELMRVDRVWRRRLTADKDLAERVEDEKERLRNG